MIRDKLQETQPIVYQTLSNAIKNKKFAHAYLFTGVKGTPKKEAALWFAQNLVCEHTEDGFACETCDECRRIAENMYADLIYLDGNDATIKKDSILQLQEQFSKTALEKSGKKFYILDMAENATTEALNSLLKFLEEPNGQDTQAILIVDSIDRLLPTIISRCQIIPFKPLNVEHYYEDGIKSGLDELDSYVLSHIVKDVDYMNAMMESEEYQTAMVVAERFVSLFDVDIHRFLVWFETEILGNKDKDKEVVKMFLEILLIFFRDVVSNKDGQTSWFEREVQRISQKNIPIERILLILLESKDKCNRSYNLQLVVEQMIHEIKEVM